VNKAHITIVLSLRDEFIREVADIESASEAWLILESLHMTKTLINKLSMKKRLHQLKTEDGASNKDKWEC